MAQKIGGQAFSPSNKALFQECPFLEAIHATKSKKQKFVASNVVAQQTKQYSNIFFKNLFVIKNIPNSVQYVTMNNKIG